MARCRAHPTHAHHSRLQHRTGYRINKVEGVGVAYANV